MRALVISSLLLLAAPAAFAGTTVCSSADQRLYYSWSVPDRGIAVPDPEEARVVLVLDGKALDPQAVEFVTSTRKRIHSESNGYGATDVYSELAKVHGGQAFSDYVLCKNTVLFVP